MALVRCPSCGRVASGSTCFACGQSLDEAAAGPPATTHADPIPPRATPGRGQPGPESWAVRAPGQGFDAFHAAPPAAPLPLDEFTAPVVEGLATSDLEEFPVVQGAALVEPFGSGPPPPDPFAPFPRSTPAFGLSVEPAPAANRAGPFHAPIDDGMAIEMTDGFEVEGLPSDGAPGIEMTDGFDVDAMGSDAASGIEMTDGFDVEVPGPDGEVAIEMTDGFDVDLPPSLNAVPDDGGFDLSFDAPASGDAFGDLAQAAAAAASFGVDDVETEVLDERPRSGTPPPPPDDDDSTALIRTPGRAADAGGQSPPALPEDAFELGALDDVPMPPSLDEEFPAVVDESTLPLVPRPTLPTPSSAGASAEDGSGEIDFGDLSLDVGTGASALSFDEQLPDIDDLSIPDLSDPLLDAPPTTTEHTLPMGSVPGESPISLEGFDDLEVAPPSAAAASTVRASLDARGDMAPHSTHAQPTRMAPPLDDALDAAAASMTRIDRSYAKELASKVGALAEELEGEGKFEAAALLYDVQTALDGES